MHRVSANAVSSQLWRNGGGRTRELLAWPSPDEWTLRVSLADIEADGPFSAFPGAERWFTVVDGAGVTLTWGAREHRLTPGAAPFCFDGTPAPDCRLIDGPTRDLNMMVRNGRGTMQPVDPTQVWRGAFSWRGLYTAAPGRWLAGDEALAIEGATLLWCDRTNAETAPWRFVGDTLPCAAWWLGFTPAAHP